MKSPITHLFVPTHKNNFRARILHLDILTLYLGVAVLICFGIFFLSRSGNDSKILGFATDVSIVTLHADVNAKRVAEGLPPLKYNGLLEIAAQKKAQDMFTRNYWSHYGPDGSTPWQFILESGYGYQYAGENLAKNFAFSDGIVVGWMNSETHRKNILSQDYSDVGYAVVNGTLGGEETTLVVQMFGRPLVDKQNSLQEVAAAVAPSQILTSITPEITQNAATTVQSQVLTNVSVTPYKMYFGGTVLFLIIIFSVFIIDLYVAAKHNLARTHGKTFAHLLFISFVIMAIFIVTKGAIL